MNGKRGRRILLAIEGATTADGVCEMGWDTKSGTPAYEIYRKFGLESVAKELKKKELVT